MSLSLVMMPIESALPGTPYSGSVKQLSFGPLSLACPPSQVE